jgi:hypothetical protein
MRASESENGLLLRQYTAREGRVEDVPGCEALTVDVDEMWREVERLNGEV